MLHELLIVNPTESLTLLRYNSIYDLLDKPLFWNKKSSIFLSLYAYGWVKSWQSKKEMTLQILTDNIVLIIFKGNLYETKKKKWLTTYLLTIKWDTVMLAIKLPILIGENGSSKNTCSGFSKEVERR